MFYGYPVEKLCTYQYSLVSLLPGNIFCLIRDSLFIALHRSFADLGRLRITPTCGTSTYLIASDVITNIWPQKHDGLHGPTPRHIRKGDFVLQCFYSKSVDISCYRMPSSNPIYPSNNSIWLKIHQAGFVDAQTLSLLNRMTSIF